MNRKKYSLLVIVLGIGYLVADSENTKKVTQETTQEYIQRLYKGVSGFKISSEESSMISSSGGAPTYGEITYESLQTILNDLALTDKDVFYDLGCGVGKTCVQVVLDTPAQAIGIELSPSRIKQAKKVQQHLIDEKKVASNKRLQFHEKNIFDEKMQDATAVFLCSTCFSADLMQKITDTLAKLKKNLKVVSLKPLPKQNNFTLEKKYNLSMTWSTSTPVYSYRLTTPSQK